MVTQFVVPVESCLLRVSLACMNLQCSLRDAARSFWLSNVILAQRKQATTETRIISIYWPDLVIFVKKPEQSIPELVYRD